MRTFIATLTTVAVATTGGLLVGLATTNPAPAATGGTTAHHAPAYPHTAHPAPWMRKPCRWSDGPGPCYFDAGTRGDHKGPSYWITRNGTARYLDGTVLHLANYDR